MGTTFINTLNQNPGCAPSRTLMHTGRYSHRTGEYGFEYDNPVVQSHWRPMVPEILRDKAGKLPPRDYIIAEPTWVIGPRAVIRTKDYKFAMKIRPRPGHTMTEKVVGEDSEIIFLDNAGQR